LGCGAQFKASFARGLAKIAGDPPRPNGRVTNEALPHLLSARTSVENLDDRLRDFLDPLADISRDHLAACVGALMTTTEVIMDAARVRLEEFLERFVM
jgi:hypothetical protein